MIKTKRLVLREMTEDDDINEVTKVYAIKREEWIELKLHDKF